MNRWHHNQTEEITAGLVRCCHAGRLGGLPTANQKQVITSTPAHQTAATPVVPSDGCMLKYVSDSAMAPLQYAQTADVIYSNMAFSIVTSIMWCYSNVPYSEVTCGFKAHAGRNM